MNEVFENNTALGAINSFVSKNRKFLLITLVTILLIVLVFISINKDSNAVNQIYNSANGDRVTITEITELIREELSKTEVEIKFGPHRNGDIPHSQASIDKAKRLLKYKPSYNLKEGIKETISWYLK